LKSDDFIAWLAEQLENISQASAVNNARVNAIDAAVGAAIPVIESMSVQDRRNVRKVIVESSKTRIIGGFRIPYDDRDTYDFIEAFLATIDGFLD
jgi:hypothetical protein